MDHAKAPFQRIFLSGFMLWMTGGMNIFSLIFTGIAFWQCVQSFLSINSYFAGFRQLKQSLFLPKLIYIAIALLNSALVFWKCRSLGLLPTAVDWITVPIPFFAEHSFGGNV